MNMNINPQKEIFHNYDLSRYTASKYRDIKLDTYRRTPSLKSEWFGTFCEGFKSGSSLQVYAKIAIARSLKTRDQKVNAIETIIVR